MLCGEQRPHPSWGPWIAANPAPLLDSLGFHRVLPTSRPAHSKPINYPFLPILWGVVLRFCYRGFPCSTVPTITARRRKDGTTGYTAQIRIRRDGRIVHTESRTFDRRRLAVEWAADRERELDKPGGLEAAGAGGATLAALIARYLEEFPAGGRSKRATMQHLARTPFATRVAREIRPADIVAHAQQRREGGAAPQTVLNDIVWLRVIFRTAQPAWDIPLDPGIVDQAAVLLRKERMIGKGKKRERRPTPAELAALDSYFGRLDGRIQIPMRDVMWFAVHSARRQGEITGLRWADLDEAAGTVLVRDVKHPGGKGFNKDSRLTAEALAIIQRQPRTGDRIFSYDTKSVSTAFTRACKMLDIEGLRFHDLRHEATSRLFEAGYSIVEVQHFTLHESWDQLKRYTNLRARDVALRQ